MTGTREKGKVVIVSGPSGVGKSTICRELDGRLKNVYLSVSATTRHKSKGEVHGRDYWFISEQEFRDRINKGLLLEYAEVFGRLYGTPKDKVEQALQADKTVILEIDVQGAKQVTALFPDAITIFILPPSAKVLAERMNHRSRDDAQKAKERLNEADSEIAAGRQYYRHKVINEDLQKTIEEIIHIIQGKSEDRRQKTEVQPQNSES